MDIYETFRNLRYHHENEVVEFKKAENNFDFDDLGKYFSALSNEANLRDKDFAWLVFGVENKTREDYITGERIPDNYRNLFLAQAMANIKMIDTEGFGIHKMFVSQKERYLPMPDYDKSDSDTVVLTMPGNVIDENYSLLLLENSEISLTTAVLLDKVQKGKPISDEAIKMLRKEKLIEGRKPHLYVSKQIAQVTDQKVAYSKHKGLAEKKCEALLVDSLKDHGDLTKQEIVSLLWDVLPDQLDDKQKMNKIEYLLKRLKMRGDIKNETSGKTSIYSLGK